MFRFRAELFRVGDFVKAVDADLGLIGFGSGEGASEPGIYVAFHGAESTRGEYYGGVAESSREAVREGVEEREGQGRSGGAEGSRIEWMVLACKS